MLTRVCCVDWEDEDAIRGTQGTSDIGSCVGFPLPVHCVLGQDYQSVEPHCEYPSACEV